MRRSLGFILVTSLIISAIAFGLKNITADNAKKEHISLMQTLLPGADDFQRVPYSGDDASIRSVHRADEGFVIEVSTMGYVDEISMLLGIDNNGSVIGLVTRSAYETPGLGNRILWDVRFLSGFIGRSGTFTVDTNSRDDFAFVDDNSSGKEIYTDAISGATVSSKAVVRCVNSAVSYVTGSDVDSSATSWGGQ